MKWRLAIILACAVGIAGVAVFRSHGATSRATDEAERDQLAPAHEEPQPGVGADSTSDAGVAAAAPAKKPATQPENEKPAELTSGEAAVMTMYDAIAAAFEKDSNDCDAMATALETIVARSKSDVQRWATEQSQLSAAERGAAARRLENAAGVRVQRAQAAVRAAMTTCQTSEHFQVALRKLVALSPTP